MNIDKDLDCIVVGSGPGGATVAREMSRKKRKCSVIPEAWGLPPTSTIIGLGKRLAKHLAAEK